MRRAFELWTPVVAYMAAIFWFSSLSDPPLPAGVSDKSLHWLAYLGLGILCVRAVAGGLTARITPRAAAMATAIAVGYAASDEFHQSFVPGRTADLYDIAADAAGALAGTAACWAWGIIRLSRPRRDPPRDEL